MGTKIDGRIRVPGDKSISHRAIMIASISQGESRISGFLPGEDCISTIQCCRGLGVAIEEKEGYIQVIGKGIHGLTEPTNLLDAGNSGTTMRLLSGILAGQDFLTIITGDKSLRQRPMDRISDPLREMGATILGRNRGSLAPLAICGGSLHGIQYKLPVASAQVKSALLLAGLYARDTTIITEEIPSRDHTEKMLHAFGARIGRVGNSISITSSPLQGQSLEVPGDISSAAFFIAAAAALPGSHLIVENVGLNPTRTGILDVLTTMGAHIELTNMRISGGEPIGTVVVHGATLHGTSITSESVPRLVDEIPVIAVIASQVEGTTRITGAAELKVKESNRISAMVQELGERGANITELPDGMEITGPTKLRGGVADSHGDHRIAMSMAICDLFCHEDLVVKNNGCIGISFPDFWEKLAEIAH